MNMLRGRNTVKIDIPPLPPQPITTAGIYRDEDNGLISLSSNGTTWITIADKNLGATTVYNDGDTLSEANCGKFYQRGNNYGFAWGDSISPTSQTQPDVSSYGPNLYYSNSTYRTVYSTGNPSYFWGSPSPINRNLRGGITNTVLARRGPCDVGFHIPSENDITSLLSVGPTGYQLARLIKLPIDGYINNGGTRVLSGNYASLITSDSYYLSNVSDYVPLRYYISESSFLSASGGSEGIHIRPFANTPVQPTVERTVLYQPN